MEIKKKIRSIVKAFGLSAAAEFKDRHFKYDILGHLPRDYRKARKRYRPPDPREEETKRKFLDKCQAKLSTIKLHRPN